MRTVILADEAELVVECAALARDLNLDVEVEFGADPIADAHGHLDRVDAIGMVFAGVPDLHAFAALARVARGRGSRVFAAILGARQASLDWVPLARDLGVVAVDETAPLIAALAIAGAGIDRPWAISLSGLPRADRERFAHLGHLRQSGGGWVSRANPTQLAIARERTAPAVLVGEPRDMEAAIVAFHAAQASSRNAPAVRANEGALGAVRTTLFGPKRTLSDPASKGALSAYGVRTPSEELCASPSRAANEASRLGFPVRIAIASPDLRVWDHPDLAVAGVENAAQVREVYRELMAAAEARARGVRILGVTVSTLPEPRALLRVRISPLGDGEALAMVGFADAHGVAAGDHTHTVLPLTPARLERVLARLAGVDLLFGGALSERKRLVESLADLLTRAAELVIDNADAIEAVEIDPLAVLYDGTAEARDAAIHVTDRFEREMEAVPTRSAS
jgi:hypothetical protein